MCQFTVVLPDNLQSWHMAKIIIVFNLVFNLIFWFNLVSQFFKTIQFCSFQIETKLVNKFNYNLYIHVKIIVLNLYIKSLHLNI